MNSKSRKPFTYTFGELIDRLTIVSKKDLFKLPGANAELNLIMGWLNDLGLNAYLMLSLIRITQANCAIWELEHQIRICDEQFNDSEIGKRARLIRNHNKTRIRYKNELDKLSGGKHIEEKIKHLSEEIYDLYYQTKEEGKANV